MHRIMLITSAAVAAVLALSATACGDNGQKKDMPAAATCGKVQAGQWKMPVSTNNACTYVMEASLVLNSGANSANLTDQQNVRVHTIGANESEPCDGVVVKGTDTKPVRWCGREGQFLLVDKPAVALLKMGAGDAMFAQVMDEHGQRVALRRVTLDKKGLLEDDRAWYAGATMAVLVKKGTLTKEQSEVIAGKIYVTPKMTKAFGDGFKQFTADLK